MQGDLDILKLIVITTTILVIIAIAVVLLFMLSIRQKNLYLHEKNEYELAFAKELNKTKMEIKDSTLKQVSQELHDNVGQIVALTRIHIKALQRDIQNERLDEINTLTDSALKELRQISKQLNSNISSEFDIILELQKIVNSIKQIDMLKVDFEVQNEVVAINKDHELILFRICQEFISNTLKYSNCNYLKIVLEYQKNRLLLDIQDDGDGFDMKQVKMGNGLQNMYNRASLLKAKIDIISSPHHGTQMKIEYKYPNASK